MTPTGRRSPGSTPRLAAFAPSPVVELNRAVAVAMAEGPAACASPSADDLAAGGQLAGYHLLPAVRAGPAPPS